MSHHYFPQEILIEILLNLPVKSLCRFITVCKSWHALITSPSFISTHLHHTLNKIANEQQNKENKTLLLRGDKSQHFVLLGREKKKLNFPFAGFFRLVGSSSGLLCLATEMFDGFHGVEEVFLWNPSIRRSIVLPKPTIEPTFPYVLVFGFGAGLRDGEDCKVVRLVYQKLSPVFGYERAQPPEVEVYSLKKRVWKKVVQPNVRCRIMPFSKSQVLMNGRVHWLAYRRRELGRKNLILAFDICDEVFSEIMVPDELSRGNRVKLCCNLFEEFLTVIKYTPGTDIMSCCIWIMKEYGVVESWTPTYSFDLVEGMEKVVAVLGDGEVLMAKGMYQLVSYNIKTSSIKDIGVFGAPPLFYVDRYVESLVLLRE